MKYIFDFDDVIFETTKHRLEHLYAVLEKAGISRKEIDEYYKRERVNLFSPKKMLKHFNLDDSLYEEIMGVSKEFLNKKFVKAIEKLGRENCYLITYGEEEFQKDKIARNEIEHLFAEIIAVPGTKKQVVENLCEKFKDEQIIFIDDKPQYFEDLDLNKYPNLKTVLYTGQDPSSVL